MTFTPRPGETLPTLSDVFEPVPEPFETYERPIFRSQFDDPAEPKYKHPPESSSRHCGGNCSCAAGAMALDFHTNGRLRKRGGDLRHHQSDLEGGTDLNDIKQAWAFYGEKLVIRTGQGWSGVRRALDDEGRAVVLQGLSSAFKEGCSSKFDGGHCIIVLPEKVDGKRVTGDPICYSWSRKTDAELEDFAKRFNSGVSFAVTRPGDTGGTGGGSMGLSTEPTGTVIGTATTTKATHLWRLVDGAKVEVEKGLKRNVFGRMAYSLDSTDPDDTGKVGYLCTYKDQSHLLPTAVATFVPADAGSGDTVDQAVKARDQEWEAKLRRGEAWPTA